ncbi:MAG: hypothetical protein J6Y37_03735 [Paludibacteraceae bacterium]|nr:hypothetical protein [Paludibacteraceae bacterium]
MADLFEKLHDRRARLFSQLNDPAAVGVWKMVVDKYSDQAHFLYELLQNADDAGATNVRILLTADLLYFIHDGVVPFSVTDVDKEQSGDPIGHLNAITSIGASSKSGTNTIGKFGVGFKSVFQYTDVPHIEDDAFCFKIVNYIVPEKDVPVSGLRRRGETLFSIPFRDSQKAFSEILDKLRRLKHPLLFLRSLRRIEWSVAEGETGSYERRILSSDSFLSTDYAFVEESQTLGRERQTSFLHLFSRDFSLSKKDALFGTVAFLAQENGALVDSPSSDDVAYCYFPTKEKTDLNFLIHAPFLLTDSREGLKQGEDWNVRMMDQLATLATDGVELLTKLHTNVGDYVLDDNLFSIIPLDRKRFFRKTKSGWESISPFSVFYDRFVEKLSSAPLFRSMGGFVDCRHTRYASDKELVQLLEEASGLSSLPVIGAERLDWTFLSLRPENNVVFDYLAEHGLVAVTATWNLLVESLTVPFLQAQSLDWLKRLYAAFSAHTAEWRVEEARKRVPIKCADGRFLPAFDEAGRPMLFLSAGSSNSFLCVDSELLSDSGCRRYFNQLGISHPDLLSEIECVVLPRYRSHSVAVDDWQTLFRDMNLFVEAYQSFRFMDSRQERFLASFKEVPLFPSTDNQGLSALRCASEIYVELPELKTFLAYDATVAFLDSRLAKEGFLPEKREAFYKFLSAVGVSFGLKVKRVRRLPGSEEALRLSLTPKSLRQYDQGDQQIEDCEIEGFSSFLSHMTEKSSVAFLLLLSDQIERQSSYMFQLSLKGQYRYVERAKKSYTEEVIAHTTAWHSLFSDRWLYDAEGNCASPSEIGSVDRLSSSYRIDVPDILFFLGISDDAAFRGLTLEQRRSVKLVRSFDEMGISVERLERLLVDYRQGLLPDAVSAYLKDGGDSVER